MLYQPSGQLTSLLNQATLNQFTVLKFSGEDSFEFLQGQLSQDMRLVSNRQAQLASYSNAKGRVLATLILWQAADTNICTYYACLPSDNALAIQKRLSMFVLRAKVRIEILQANIDGLWWNSPEIVKDRLGIDCHPQSHPIHNDTFSVHQKTQAHFIHYPSRSPGDSFSTGINQIESPPYFRLLAINFADTTPLCSEYEKADENEWYMQDILAGLPWITSATKEVFTAQSINQDVLHAINFTKGCYPGQEVIARSHYRGIIKRRSVIGVINQPSADTNSLLASDIIQGEDIVGQVVNATSFADKTYILFEAPLEAITKAGGQASVLDSSVESTSDRDKAQKTAPPIELRLANNDAPIAIYPVHYSLHKPE